MGCKRKGLPTLITPFDKYEYIGYIYWRTPEDIAEKKIHYVWAGTNRDEVIRRAKMRVTKLGLPYFVCNNAYYMLSECKERKEIE